ncbi:MAG: thiamine diphosphokinase [Marinibacterium sp.]|nr:thiamine diphosphokinase [Marinibacterium sp.]
MTMRIVQSDTPACLVGGGPVLPGDIADAQALAPLMVAADGGARALLDAGVMPDAVIGDLDSLDPATRAAIPATRVHLIAEQNSTDFDKALRSIAAPVVIGLGFLGARIDHQLAALNTLHARADRACLLVGDTEIVLHLPPRLSLPTRSGDTVSLFPLAPVTGRSDGLHWPIDGITLAPGGMSGTSNRACGPVELVLDGPGCLGIVPRHLLAPLVRTLGQPDAARWPVRAG